MSTFPAPGTSTFGSEFSNPNYTSMFGTMTAPLSQAQQMAGDISMGAAPGQMSLFNLGIPQIQQWLTGNVPNMYATQYAMPGQTQGLGAEMGMAGGGLPGQAGATLGDILGGNIGGLPGGGFLSSILGGGTGAGTAGTNLQNLLTGNISGFGPAGTTAANIMGGGGLPNALQQLMTGNVAGMGPAGQTYASTAAGQFPGLQANVGDVMQQLQSALWGQAQPGLEQGAQQIASQATAAGQRGLSTPAAQETGSMYRDVLSNIAGQVGQAGIGQYQQDIAQQNQAAQNILNSMLGVGQTQYGTQAGMAQNLLNAVMGGGLTQAGRQQDIASNLLQQALGTGQYAYGQQAGAAQNLLQQAMQNWQTQLGLQQGAQQQALGAPGTAISALTGTGGLAQTTAQNALNALYQLYTGQGNLQQQNVQDALSMILQGITVPGASQQAQYGPSGFSQMLGGAASLLPLFLGSNPVTAPLAALDMTGVLAGGGGGAGTWGPRE